MMIGWAAAFWLAAAGPVAAQDLGWGTVSPSLLSPDRQDQGERASEPLAQALDLALGATVWAQVRISTAGPAADLSRLVRSGFYKLELIQLVLMSAETGKPLQKTVEKRRKGAGLGAIAKDYGLDYDRIYEAALAVQETVDREYLPRFPERAGLKGRPSWKESD
jgi:hypothetical protein